MPGKRTKTSVGRPKKSTRAPSNINQFNNQRKQSRRLLNNVACNNSLDKTPHHEATRNSTKHPSLLSLQSSEQNKRKMYVNQARDDFGKWVSFETAISPSISSQSKKKWIGRTELSALSGRLFEMDSPDRKKQVGTVRQELLEGNRLIPIKELKDNIEDKLLYMNCSRKNATSTLDSLCHDIQTEFCKGNKKKEKKSKEIF